MERQLRRQSIWLKESLLWLLRTKVLGKGEWDEYRPTALDVGCGPGFIMNLFRRNLSVIGVDIDADMVAACRSRGFNVEKASTYELPYDDGEFDVVYCTFLLLWLEDPAKALGEMARVSREHVLCLAEPDMGSRIDHPEELAGLGQILAEGMRIQGADPFMGRKLRELFRRCGLSVELGVHPGVWDINQLGQEFDDEWRFVEVTATEAPKEELWHLKDAWRKAISAGTLFQYNPIFYAIGCKPL